MRCAQPIAGITSLTRFGQEEVLVVSHSKPTVSELCEKLKQIGFRPGSHVQIYGDRLEVVSDPFPHDNGIAVRARAERDSAVRIIQLPAPILPTSKAA
jgi:hypothetical protein